MWVDIDFDNTTLLNRYVEIMGQMDAGYKDIVSVDSLRRIMTNRRGVFSYYKGNLFEIVTGFKFTSSRKQYRILHLGVDGIITPQEVASLILERYKAFANEHPNDTLYAIRPNIMSNPFIVLCHDEVAKQPWIEVNSLTEDAVIWNVKPLL